MDQVEYLNSTTSTHVENVLKKRTWAVATAKTPFIVPRGAEELFVSFQGNLIRALWLFYTLRSLWELVQLGVKTASLMHFQMVWFALRCTEDEQKPTHLLVRVGN